MKLQAWLDLKGLSHADFARLVNRERSTVTRWALGRMPNQSDLATIRDVTSGAVTANDWVDDTPRSSAVSGVPPAQAVTGSA
jgi:transcriptional regulator with XRE-family HTH domain